MCNELDAALVAFDDVYTAYHQLLDENDIDDSKAYYDLVLRDVQELKHQAGQLLDNVPVHVDEPPELSLKLKQISKLKYNIRLKLKVR